MYLKTQTAFGMVPGRIIRLMNTIGYKVLNPWAAFLSKITMPWVRQLSRTDSFVCSKLISYKQLPEI